MRQPETMDEMVRSVENASVSARTRVIGTLYGQLPEELPTSLRTIFRAALTEASASGNNLNEMNPGDTYTLQGQTDVWYIQRDPQGTFSHFINLITAATRGRR